MINPIFTNNCNIYTFRGRNSAAPIIRKLSRDNFDEIYPLYVKYRESAGVKSSIEEVKEYLLAESQRNEDEIFITQKNGEPAGFLHFGKEYSTLRPDFRYRIKALFVDTAYRGLGLAKSLLETMKQFAGSKEIVVKARKSNQNSPRVYRNSEFQEDSEYIHFIYKKD